MQKAQFIQKQLRVTQGPGVGSHRGSLAVDFGGKDGGKDKCYAPYDCEVVRIRQGANGECYIQSLEPVLAADGTVDYQHMLLIHTNAFDVKAGQVVKQGEHFYTEGGMKGGNPTGVANHVHVEAGFGKSPARQVQNASGTWVVPGQARIEQLLFLPPEVEVLKDGGFGWKRLEAAAAQADGQETREGYKFRVLQSYCATENLEYAMERFLMDRAGEPLIRMRLCEDGKLRIYAPVATTVSLENAQSLLTDDRFILVEE